ncbi:hypothetical protein [Rhizobium sp. SSA_523]|uniref:hypothetical protein n=1 Tax=Rhizobium sp. SSA_523 TaxID=2952477 RepID=UPI0020917BA7|nr:hypothetical protein [Rhizobium sp. SSA_523]MCO5733946.1 hypothetical protein [Rhizobium sp. SSA_523]WKC24794.1 hypothetical protein QTJ18_12280 [Rhizobium sp. SSA_523]
MRQQRGKNPASDSGTTRVLMMGGAISDARARSGAARRVGCRRTGLSALAGLAVLTGLPAGLAAPAMALANEGTLIWNPTKASDTSYQARLGSRIPGYAFASAGVDVGLNAPSKGGRIDVPVKLWGRITTEALQTPAYQLRQDVDLHLDALNGHAMVKVSDRDVEILSGDLTLELTRDVSLRYDGAAAAWQGVDVRQSIRWTVPQQGTSLTAQVGLINNFQRLGGGVTLEQKLGPAISVKGQVGQAAGEDVTASISARYTMRW